MNEVKIPEPSFSNTSEARERLPINEYKNHENLWATARLSGR